MPAIKSIQKGIGELSKSWTVGNKYTRIVEELKPIRFGEGGVYEMVVYRVYGSNNTMLHEIESNGSLVISFSE